jgi:hypothetical protein
MLTENKTFIALFGILAVLAIVGILILLLIIAPQGHASLCDFSNTCGHHNGSALAFGLLFPPMFPVPANYNDTVTCNAYHQCANHNMPFVEHCDLPRNSNDTCNVFFMYWYFNETR